MHPSKTPPETARLFSDLAPQLYKIGIETGLSYWSKESYAEELSKTDSFGLGVFSKDRLIGFILIRLLIPDEAEILNFAIDKNHQQKGFGKALFDTMVQYLRQSQQTRKIWLEVRASNSQAIRFYEKRGFEIASGRKNFYSQPVEDALVMKLEL